MASIQMQDWRYDSVQQRTPAPIPPAPTGRQARIALSPVPGSARAAREFTTATLTRWHLGELVSDAALIVSELVTNAISHGSPEPGAQVELTWSYQASRLICVITDRTTGAPVVQAENPEAESGHGLQIVAALAAAWGWTMMGTGEKAVWAALDLPEAAIVAIAEAGLAAGGI